MILIPPCSSRFLLRAPRCSRSVVYTVVLYIVAMDLDEAEPEDVYPPILGCFPPHDSSLCFNTPEYYRSQDREEEEIMMSHALEALPEWRSPSRSDEWGRRSDVSLHKLDVADAISKRTRARYSLADMSLDQLETFLQESEEEDYFQNVDDEEEYRKFLAAVQEKVVGQEDDRMGKEIEESESDEDADFEVEIEEALESEIEEGIFGSSMKRKRSRRLVTKENRRKRESPQNKVLRSGFAKTPLRLLLPYSGNVSVERSRFLASSASRPWLCSTRRQPSCFGFTAHQIGQLYCLIHEHVQLLLQVYAICILEPAMQQMAVDSHRMLMELVEKREAILSWKKSAFPDFCFRPPYIHPSVPEDEVSFIQNLLPKTSMVVNGIDGACCSRVTSNSGSQWSGVLPQSLHSHSFELVGSPSQVNDAGLASALTILSSLGQTKSVEKVYGNELALSSSSAFPESLHLEWVPAISGPVRSLLDVAPLALVGEFVKVVDQIVQASNQQDFRENLRIPLFAVGLQVSPKLACEGVKAHLSSTMKKTMAAAVESSEKQTMVFVPKDIAAAMERFIPLFNKSLFPHRAPHVTAANRQLFTVVEDELLAMGLMTYNNDWKAIQGRFLPSKSIHQIFVRQKNRSSARAPYNSIKAVRRIKTAPLTANEIACIEEALKQYKYDWTEVCQFYLPHRDPAILPRQWRVALGTQKSYISIPNLI